MLRAHAWCSVAAVAISILLMSNGCSKLRRESGAGDACIADSIGSLHLLSTVPSCATDELLCRVRCTAGSAAFCVGLAYEIQKEAKNEDEAIRLYRRACVLGAAIGCTNYAASIWAGRHTDSELACARRTFEKACGAKEAFGCGMVGRLMLENTNPPSYAEGRNYLERACNEVGGFPCRVLAKHLESGKLGKYEPRSIRELLRKACSDGDPDACGEPKTASETFQ